MLKNWNGSDGAFRPGRNWSPKGAPHPGDSLVIDNGTAALRGGSFGSADARTSIHLTGDASHPATLLLGNTTLANVAIDEVTGVPGDYTARTGTLAIDGRVNNDGGSITAAGNVPVGHVLDLEMGPHATLVNRGSIAANPNARLNMDGPGTATLENDGTINAAGGTITVAPHLTGTGDVYAQEGMMVGGKVELEGAVDAGQTVHLFRALVQIDAPKAFLGALDVPAFSGSVSLEGLQAASWASNGNLLELFDASGALADTVRLTPQASPVDLQVSTFTDPAFGAGVSLRAVPAGYQADTPNLLPQHSFV